MPHTFFEVCGMQKNNAAWRRIQACMLYYLIDRVLSERGRPEL